MSALTSEQKETIRELRREIKDLGLQADEQWAKYIQTKDEDCYQAVLALDGEAAMLSAVAYVPKKGERKIGRVRDLVAKVKGANRDSNWTDSNGMYHSPFQAPEGTEARIRSLESVNAWREHYNLPPLERLPRGIPGDSHECVLARAFKLSLAEMGHGDSNVGVGGSADVELRVMGESGFFQDLDYTPTMDSWASQL